MQWSARRGGTPTGAVASASPNPASTSRSTCACRVDAAAAAQRVALRPLPSAASTHPPQRPHSAAEALRLGRRSSASVVQHPCAAACRIAASTAAAPAIPAGATAASAAPLADAGAAAAATTAETAVDHASGGVWLAPGATAPALVPETPAMPPLLVVRTLPAVGVADAPGALASASAVAPAPAAASAAAVTGRRLRGSRGCSQPQGAAHCPWTSRRRAATALQVAPIPSLRWALCPCDAAGEAAEAA